MRRFANIIARTKHEGLTCVRWVTIQNEPNQAPTDLAQKRNPLLSMRLYERLYRLLDEELTKRGIRDTVELVAGDLDRIPDAALGELLVEQSVEQIGRAHV